MTKIRPTTQQLTEQTYSESVRVDPEAGVIRGVKILGRESRNRRVYSEQAMRQAAPLYEGCVVHLDHPQDPRQPRRFDEGFGVLRNVTMRENGVYGDLEYMKSHPQAQSVVEWAQRFPDKFGLSHNATCGVVDGRGKSPSVVESIRAVESVDIVRRPATNRGLFEHEEPMPKTVKQLLAEQKADKHAERFLKLLEMDGMEPMGDVPIEASEGGGDQVKDAFKAMVVGVLDDESLDMQAKLAKIREILKAEEKLSGAGEAPAETPSEETPASEQIDPKLDQRLSKIEATLEKVSESLTAPAPQRPRIGSAARQQQVSESYESLKAQVERERKRSLATARK